MALKKCKECDREISSSVKKCPHCGKRQKKPIWKRWWIWIILALFIFIVISSGGGTSKPSEEYKTASTEEIKQKAIESLNYDELFRNNSQYVGKVVHYLGKVVQVQESSGDSYVLRANVTKGEYGSWENDVFLHYNGERVLEDDVIEFWGEVKGVKKYKTVMAGQRSIPEIVIIHSKILGDSASSAEMTEVVAPAKKTVDVGKTNSQKGFSVTIDKIELADEETRVYLTVKNNTKYKTSFYTYSAKIVQGGKQFDQKTIFSEREELPSEFLPGIEANGIVAFPAINLTGNIKIVLDKPYFQDVSFDEMMADEGELKEVVFEVNFS